MPTDKILPPGPRDGVLSQTVGFHRDPLGFLRAGQVEFGDVLTIRLLTARPTRPKRTSPRRSRGQRSTRGTSSLAAGTPFLTTDKERR